MTSGPIERGQTMKRILSSCLAGMLLVTIVPGSIAQEKKAITTHKSLARIVGPSDLTLNTLNVVKGLSSWAQAGPDLRSLLGPSWAVMGDQVKPTTTGLQAMSHPGTSTTGIQPKVITWSDRLPALRKAGLVVSPTQQPEAEFRLTPQAPFRAGQGGIRAMGAADYSALNNRITMPDMKTGGGGMLSFELQGDSDSGSDFLLDIETSSDGDITYRIYGGSGSRAEFVKSAGSQTITVAVSNSGPTTLVGFVSLEGGYRFHQVKVTRLN